MPLWPPSAKRHMRSVWTPERKEPERLWQPRSDVEKEALHRELEKCYLLGSWVAEQSSAKPGWNDPQN